jgi:rhodanese-related sulfurtransferase
VIYRSVDEMLEAARDGLARLTPEETVEAVAAGAMIVDIRPEWQRRAYGEVAGALVVERNHLEWRVHPASDARLPQADVVDRWIVLCMEGYTSSLAARALVDLGVDAADVEGGINAWKAAGLPVVASVTPVEQVVGADAAPVPSPLLHPVAG